MADVLWSVCLSVSVCEWDTLVSHAKMIESIPDAVWAVDSSVSELFMILSRILPQ